MKNLSIALIFFAAFSFCIAQPDFPQGEFHGFYQRIQGFDFKDFDVQGADFNGGGLGFVFNLNHWFGIWNQNAFYGGTEREGIQMRLILEQQGVKLTKRELGRVNVYAKAGMGFVRYVFELPSFDVVRFGMSFNYGGGVEVKMSDAMALFFEANRLSLALPDISGARDRDAWDSNTLFTTGVAFSF